MRGLKRYRSLFSHTVQESHLLQMRGLKLQLSTLYQPENEVASFTDAWIETYRVIKFYRIGKVASFTDAWIET